MQFSYRVFEQGGDRLLAISDAAIVGKTFSGGELEITVSRDFYAAGNCNANDVLKLIKGATIVNAVGNDIIGLLCAKGFVDRRNVLLIGDVPHAQIIIIR